MSCCSAPVSLSKVAAHTGNFGNDLADCIAKRGAAEEVPWVVSFQSLPDIKFFPCHRGQWQVEGDLRAYLKLQSKLRISVTWEHRERVQQCIPFFESVDWDSTILNIHSGNLPGSLATSVSMCSARAYRVKVLHGMLPVATRLFITRPDLYHDDLCPHCYQVPETVSHLWRCSYSQDAVLDIAREGAVLFWKLATASWQGARLSQSSLFPGPFSIFDAIQGIVPGGWTSLLCSCGLSSLGTKSVVRKVGVFFVSSAHDNIWKPQCEAQIVQEHGLHITQHAKTCGKMRVVRPRHSAVHQSRITHITRALAGSCTVCLLSLVDHSGGVCPPLVAQAPFLADDLLQLHHQSLCILSSIHNLHVQL